jgi:hypothetical protein
MRIASLARYATCCLLTAFWLADFAVATEPDMAHASSVTPKEHQRGTEQTFLTFPEWFLVHSPAEYAAFVKDQPPSEFPFVGHIKQLWQSYGAVYGATRNKYPFNFGYHAMIVVISMSTTVEYLLKAAYETLIGRLTELTRTHGMTQEDVFSAQVAQDYVDFIRVHPFYQYDFLDKLTRLWKETSFWGPDMLRKWERKYALTSEYGAKAIYSWLIKKATEASYDPTIDVTAVVIDRLPDGIGAELPELKVLQTFPDNSALILVPRYDAFKVYSQALARRGCNFREIAGNRSVILVSVLVPRAWLPPTNDSEVLFTQPILTQPALKRAVIIVPVESLGATLNSLNDSGFYVEHVYDY